MPPFQLIGSHAAFGEVLQLRRSHRYAKFDEIRPKERIDTDPTWALVPQPPDRLSDTAEARGSKQEFLSTSLQVDLTI